MVQTATRRISAAATGAVGFDSSSVAQGRLAVNVAMASLLDEQQLCARLCVRAAGSCSGGRLPYDLPTAVEGCIT